MVTVSSQKLVKFQVRKAVLVSLISTVLALLLVPTHIQDGGWILAFAFMDDFSGQAAFSDHDILIKAGRVIPFIFYRFLSNFLIFGIESNDIFYWGLALTLPIVFYLMWCIGYLISQSTHVASAATIAFAMVPPTTGCLMYTPFPYYSFVSSSFVMPLLLYALLLVLKGLPELAVVPAAITFLFHPGFGVMSGTIVCVAILCELRTIDKRRLVISAVVAVLVIIPVLMIMLQQSTKSGELYLYLLERISFHTYPERFWPDQFLKTGLLTSFIFFRTPCGGEDLGWRMKMVAITVVLLVLTYMAGLYVFESRFIVQMYLWRSSVFLKPLSLTLFLVFLFDQLSKPDSKFTLCKMIIALVGLACDDGQGSYFGGLILAFGIIIIVSENIWVPAAAAFVLCYLIVLSPLKALDPLYFAGVLCAPLFGYFAARENACHVRSDARYGIIVTCILALFCVMLKGPNTWANFKPRIAVALESNLNKTEDELIKWAKNSTPHRSMFVVPPGDGFYLMFRAMSKRSIFFNITDLVQLVYAPEEMMREEYIRGVDLGLEIIPAYSFLKRYTTAFKNYPCNALKVARKHAWVDYVIFSVGKDPVEDKSLSVFKNEKFIVYESKVIRSFVCPGALYTTKKAHNFS